MPFGLANPAHLETEGDIVEAIEVREQGIALKHHARPALYRRQVGDVLVTNQDVAIRDRFVPGDHP